MKEYLNNTVYEKIKLIDCQKLDLVSVQNGYSVYHGNEILTTPSETEITHTDSRLLMHLIFELTVTSIRSDKINGYILFSVQKDFIEKNNDYLLENFDEIFDNDYLTKVIFGKPDKNAERNVEKLMNYFENNKAMLNLVFGGVMGVNFILQKFFKNVTDVAGPDYEVVYVKYKNFAREIYVNLEPEYKTAVNALCVVHGAGFMLPLLLVKGYITPSEYSNLLFGFLLNNQPERIIENKDEPEKIISSFYYQSNYIKSYLTFAEERKGSENDIINMIKQGEGFNIEFKTSFRWNVKTSAKDTAIEHANLKTIAAFLNSTGGNLLVGVRDDGSIEGIEIDKFESDDKFLLHVWNLIKETLGKDISPYVRTALMKIEGKTVCNIQCLRSPAPVFLKHKGFEEEFYIRSGPSSVKLSIGDALKFISKRF